MISLVEVNSPTNIWILRLTNKWVTTKINTMTNMIIRAIITTTRIMDTIKVTNSNPITIIHRMMVKFQVHKVMFNLRAKDQSRRSLWKWMFLRMMRKKNSIWKKEKEWRIDMELLQVHLLKISLEKMILDQTFQKKEWRKLKKIQVLEGEERL